MREMILVTPLLNVSETAFIKFLNIPNKSFDLLIIYFQKQITKLASGALNNCLTHMSHAPLKNAYCWLE